MNSRFDAPANLNKIRTLLGNLETLDGEFRSEAANVLEDYALSDSLAYHLQVRGEDGQPLVDLLIGKRSGANKRSSGPSHQHGVMACVRTYESPIDHRLEEQGMEAIATVSLLVKEALVRVAEPSLVPAI